MANILNLPNEMLCKIMEYVPASERQTVAFVHPRFASVMEIPRLWTSQEFVFEGPQLDKSREQDLENVCRFQSRWKRLDLKFCRLTKKAADRMKRLTTTLRKEFTDIWMLERLTVTFAKKWHSFEAEEIFAVHFSSIFCLQSKLKEVNIVQLNTSHFNVCKILAALLDGCGETVTTLKLVEIFRTYNPGLHTSRRFENLVASFTNLRHLEINNSYLSGDLLHLLAALNSGQLETLTLWFSTPNITHLHDDPHLSQPHDVLKEACPKLTVLYKHN